MKFVDLNGDGVIDDNDRTVIGTPHPKFTAGLSNTFRYRNLSLSFLLTGQYGNQIYNYTIHDMARSVNNNAIAAYDRRWRSEESPGDGWYPVVGPKSGAGADRNKFSTYQLEDASYLCIKNVSLGYTFPASLLKRSFIKGLSVSLNIDKLYELSAGADLHDVGQSQILTRSAMNKRIHTILLASALLCASGCSEFLDVDATDAYVTEENISTVEDIDMLVTGTYGSLMENGLYGEMIYLINDVRSDNGFPNQNTFTANLYRLEIEDFAETTLNTGIIQFWQQHWRAVGRCNFALEMARKIDPSVKGNERVTEYIGEAKFLRALYMFNLVRTFGRIPVVTAYCRDVLDAREHRPRSSTEIYDQILRDLTDAEDCLDVTESESGRAGSGAVLALKGKVYLTMAGYPYNDRTLNPDGLDAGECYRLALANLNQLTEPGTVYDYALMPSYYDLFDPAKENRDPQNRTNPEDIFSVQFKSGTGIGLGSPYPRAFGEYEYSFQIPNGGKASCVPHADLLDAFVYTPKQDNLNGVVLADPAAPRDARGMAVPAAQGGTAYGLGCTVTGTVRGYGGNGLYMTGKYLTMKTSSTIADDADNNFYVLRLGDVILMQAEALWELGRHAEAVDKLNEIVDRANATLEDPAQRIMRYSLTPGDGSGRYPGDFRVIPTDDAWSARKMILDERRRELAFEGQRWFDLVRCNR